MTMTILTQRMVAFLTVRLLLIVLARSILQPKISSFIYRKINILTLILKLQPPPQKKTAQFFGSLCINFLKWFIILS